MWCREEDDNRRTQIYGSARFYPFHIFLRMFLPAFTSAVRSIFSEFLAGLGIDMTFQNVDSELADLPGKKYTSAGNGALFVLEDIASGRLAGCIALKDLGDGIAEAKRLFVRPEFRGKDLGRLLLVHIIEIAQQSGYDKIRLDTLARFTEANALYKILGFQRIDPYNYNPEDDVLYFELAGLPDQSYKNGRQSVYQLTPRARASKQAPTASSSTEQSSPTKQ